MCIHLAQPGAFSDLGDVWLRNQIARLTQKHVQFGRHFRIDADALLAQSARSTRATKAAAMTATEQTWSAGCFRRATQL